MSYLVVMSLLIMYFIVSTQSSRRSAKYSFGVNAYGAHSGEFGLSNSGRLVVHNLLAVGVPAAVLDTHAHCKHSGCGVHTFNNTDLTVLPIPQSRQLFFANMMLENMNAPPEAFQAIIRETGQYTIGYWHCMSYTFDRIFL